MEAFGVLNTVVLPSPNRVVHWGIAQQSKLTLIENARANRTALRAIMGYTENDFVVLMLRYLNSMGDA